MRVQENKEVLSYESMFHIPFDKRGKVKTQRFSMPGLPCLYISNSAYGCWEEMMRPPLDKCYVSQLENTAELELVDLSYPSIDDWMADDGKERMKYALRRIPLIISSMIKVKNEDDVFKPEYIIPQLIMEMVVNRNTKQNGLLAMGVYYTSVHINNDFHFDQKDMRYKMNNIAVAPQSTLHGRYCKKLCDLFSITNPTCDELEQAKTAGYRSVVEVKNVNMTCYPYASSVFGQLENRLNNRDMFPLHQISYK